MTFNLIFSYNLSINKCCSTRDDVGCSEFCYIWIGTFCWFFFCLFSCLQRIFGLPHHYVKKKSSAKDIKVKDKKEVVMVKKFDWLWQHYGRILGKTFGHLLGMCDCGVSDDSNMCSFMSSHCQHSGWCLISYG